MRKKWLIVIALVIGIAGAVVAERLVAAKLRAGHDPELDAILVDFAREFNATLPVKVDAATRLDSTAAGPGNRFTYYYTLVTITKEKFDVKVFTEIMRPQLVQHYKTNETMVMLRKKEVVLEYDYRDRNGAPVTKIVLSPKDLK